MIEGDFARVLLLGAFELPALALLAHIAFGIRQWLRMRAKRLEWERAVHNVQCSPLPLRQIKGMEITTIEWEQTRPDVIHIVGEAREGVIRCCICGEAIPIEAEPESLVMVGACSLRVVSARAASAAFAIYCSPSEEDA